MTAAADANPLLQPWTGPLETPVFGAVKLEHYRPAFDAAIAEHKAEIDAIAGSAREPDFDNTIAALERSGETLDRVGAIFFNLAGVDASDELQAIEREMAPILSRHSTEISLNEALFRRIDSVYRRRDRLGLSPEQQRVLERTHTNFARAGAGLDAAGKKRLAEINERLSVLGTQFGQNVLADERAWTLVLESEADRAGLPASLLAAAAEAANERGMPGKHVITLSRSSIEPFLTFSTRRDLREKAFQAWAKRGDNGGETDNRAIIAEMVKLRAERGRLMGYPTYAHFRIADTMAKTPEAVSGLLDSVWGPARSLALREAADLRALIAAEGGNFTVAASDWRFYAERVRNRRFDLDDTELKPYLQLDRMIEAAFYTANRLFGLTFKELSTVPTYHPDVRVWEVADASGAPVGLFLGDYFARPTKRSGAWMSGFRGQQKLRGDIKPIILNVLNFAKPAKGEPALLSFDEARTLFHEFGHALHGLLSNVIYPLLSGTGVAMDFVELPSQLYEHWLEQPEVLQKFAIHAETGKPMPEALLRRLIKSRTFNQGFATVEYTSSAYADLDLHLVADGEVDAASFERAELERIGMPEPMAMRHRLPHFQHVFAGSGYSAGYYSYLWSEVLDADAFAAFKETGDVFDPATAARLKEFVYSAGNLRDPDEAYRAFRGRAPDPTALLRKRGLDKAVTGFTALSGSDA
jgi:peptidyl-dipeptidase Dcp